MEAIKAHVRNGRVETDEPLGLPEGMTVFILPRGQTPDDVDPWDETPEGIAQWLAWYDSLEPLIFTAEERKALEDDGSARRAWELAHFDERADKLRRLWE